MSKMAGPNVMLQKYITRLGAILRLRKKCSIFKINKLQIDIQP